MAQHLATALLLALSLVALVVPTHGLAASGAAASRFAAAAAAAPSRRRLTDAHMGRKGRPQSSHPSGGMVMPQQQARTPDPPPEGATNFYLYCRDESRVMWYPVSQMRGDGQSNAIVGAWLNSPVAKSVFKNRLDEGMARSIFESEKRLVSMARQQYPPLKKEKKPLEWGYKVVSKELMAKEAAGEIEKQKIVPVSRDMIKDSWIDQAKQALNV